jgi:hypothetical protein
MGGLLYGLLGGLGIGLLGGFVFLLGWLLVGLLIESKVSFDFSSLYSGLFSSLIYFGPFCVLLYGLRFGGHAYLHHFALRIVLRYNTFAPLHYIRFLDYATSRIFLRKVGGGYVFVHRLLSEYFAALHQTSACSKAEEQH